MINHKTLLRLRQREVHVGQERLYGVVRFASKRDTRDYGRNTPERKGIGVGFTITEGYGEVIKHNNNECL